MASVETHRLPGSALLALIIGSTLLAFGPMLVRLSDVGPVSSGFWRMAIAAPVLVALAFREDSALRGGNWRHLPLGLGAMAGLWFAADLASWHSGIIRTTTANATLFGNCTAFLLAGWAILVQGQKAKRAVLISLALAAAGTGLLLGNSAEIGGEHLAGDLLSLLAAAFYTGYILTVMKMRDRFATSTVLGLATLSCAALLLPAALFFEPEQFWPQNWWPLVALAISSQILGQGLMVYSSGRLPAPVIGLGLLVQPMVSAVSGWMVFGEALGLIELVGGAMIVAALVMIRR